MPEKDTGPLVLIGGAQSVTTAGTRSPQRTYNTRSSKLRSSSEAWNEDEPDSEVSDAIHVWVRRRTGRLCA